jgi:ABC-type amino acid transport substrate-binding protein
VLLINWLSNFLNMLEASGQLKGLTEKWFQDGAWIKDLP